MINDVNQALRQFGLPEVSALYFENRPTRL